MRERRRSSFVRQSLRRKDILELAQWCIAVSARGGNPRQLTFWQFFDEE